MGVKSLERQVQGQEKILKQIKQEIQALEQQLGAGNKRYLNIVQKKQDLEQKMNQLAYEQVELKKQLEKHLTQARQLLSHQVLVHMSAQTEPGVMLARGLLLEELNQQVLIVQDQLAQNELATANLEQLHQRYQLYQENEGEVIAILNELENQKKMVVQQYLSESEKKDELHSRYQKVKAQFLRSQAQGVKLATELKFSAPLNEYTKMDYGSKGISFSYKGQHPVLTTQTGTVVYSGELSTFGNVVMVDHGKETRSVILGDFIPQVETGTQVSQGDVVGYTSDRVAQGQVYFEVRHKNNVQNTIQLMESRVLDQSALARR